MRLSSEYDVFIFDCDGVILDSNNLKLNAMAKALKSYSSEIIQESIEHFSKNFGLSRYLHVEHFLNKIIKCKPEEYQDKFDNIIQEYACSCTLLYKESKVNKGFINFIDSVKVDKYVVSGSDEKELRQVFSERGLDVYFKEINGSPESKINNIRNILNKGYKKGVMFGDALGDLLAAKENNIDFIFLSELSLAPQLVRGSPFFIGNEIKNFLSLL